LRLQGYLFGGNGIEHGIIGTSRVLYGREARQVHSTTPKRNHQNLDEVPLELHYRSLWSPLTRPTIISKKKEKKRKKKVVLSLAFSISQASEIWIGSWMLQD